MTVCPRHSRSGHGMEAARESWPWSDDDCGGVTTNFKLAVELVGLQEN